MTTDTQTGAPRAFEAGFRRSRRGNLWRRLPGGRTVTVFAKDGGYAWCVAGEDGPTFSPGGYDSEADAPAAAWEELGDGGAV